MSTLAALLAAVFAGGQLIVDDYGLKDVAARGDVVYQAKVIKPPRKGKGELEVEIISGHQLGTEKSALAPGSKLVTKIYGGVVWTNPRKSPIEHRLEGSTPAGELKPGSAVLVVQHSGGDLLVDLLAADEANLRKVALLFDPAGADNYARTADAAAMSRDLADRDLAEWAYDALSKRGPIAATTVLAAQRSVLERHWAALDESGKRAFLGELRGADAKTQRAMLAFALRKFDSVPLDALRPYLDVLDPLKPDELRAMSDVHTAMRGKPDRDYSALADFLARFERHRPRYLSSDESLRALAERMSPAAQVSLAKQFLESVHDSSQANREVDYFLLKTAIELAERHPSVELLGSLAKVDPLRSRTWGTQKTIMGAILAIGAAVAKQHAARAHAVVAPLIEHRVPAEKEDLDRYRAAIGDLPAPAAQAANFELQPGESRYLPGGARVAVDGESVAFYSRADTGNNTLIEGSGPWFREQYLEGWRYDLQRQAGGKRVRFTITPQPAPVEQLSDPQLYKIAQAAAEKSKCGDYDSHQHEAWNGIFFYQTARCRLVLGGYSGRVLHQATPPD